MNAPYRVLVAGSGVAGLEALLALDALAGPRVHLTLLAARPTFTIPALTVGEPFGHPPAPTWNVKAICADVGAEIVHGTLAEVRPDAHQAVLTVGRVLSYDALVVAVGASPTAPFEGALTFGCHGGVAAMRTLVDELDRGVVDDVAFVVPPGRSWTLPAYELALLTAERADEHNRDVRLRVVTPEAHPLERFGADVSHEIGRLLRDRRVELHARSGVTAVHDGRLVLTDGREGIGPVGRVVTVPVLHGRPIAGLPADDAGFLPADDAGRLPGCRDVFAVGDGAAVGFRQGGLAAQHADAAARAIARAAGADVVPAGDRRVLRAEIFAGSHRMQARGTMPETGPADAILEPVSSWPATKTFAPYLTPYLRTHAPVASR